MSTCAFCYNHDGVEAVIFCSDCGNKLMCKDCHAKAHSKATHNTLLVANVLESNSAKHIPFLESRLQALKDKLTHTEERAASLAKLKEEVLSRVHKFFTKALDDALSNREKCLAYALENVKYNKNDSEDISERISLIEEALLCGKGIAESAGYLTEKLATSYLNVEQMMKEADPVLEIPDFTYQIEFIEDNLNEVLSAINKVGTINARKHINKIPSMSPLIITQSPNSVSTAGGHQQIPGNAVTVSWTSPAEGFKFDYQVEYRAKGEQNFDLCWDGSEFMSCTLRGALRNGVVYSFRARCGYKALDEWGEWSPLTDFCVSSSYGTSRSIGSAAAAASSSSAGIASDGSVSPGPIDSGESVFNSALLDSLVLYVGKPLWNGVALSWKFNLNPQMSTSPKISSDDKSDNNNNNNNDTLITGITYQVERKRKSLFERKFQKVYEGGETECICGGLDPETSYEVRVRCKHGIGDTWGKWSRAEVRTQAIPAVDCFRQELTSWHSIHISWAPIPSYPGGPADAITYQVYKKLRSASAYESIPVYEGREPSFSCDKLSHETAYQFRIRGGAGNVWGKWDEIVVRTPEITAPDSIYAEANSWHEIVISWAPVPSYPGKPVTYQLTRKLQWEGGSNSTRASLDGRPSGEFFGSYSRSRSLDISRNQPITYQIADTLSPASYMSSEWREEDDSKPIYEGEDTTFTCSDFKPIEVYDIQVRAGCEGAWSKWSKISITTPGLPQPTPLTATPKSWYEIAFSWPEVTAPINVTLTYQADWKFGTEDSYDMAAMLYEGRRHAISRSIFQPDTLYDFRYRVGLNNDKWSNWSESTRVKTPRIPPPEGVVAKEAQWNCASFAWNPVHSQKGRNINYQLKLYIDSGECENNNDNGDETGEVEDKQQQQQQQQQSMSVAMESAEPVYTQTTEWNFGRLLPDTDYTFRVCSGCDKKWSEWSEPVIIHTLQAPAFAGSGWKECAATIETHKRYALQGSLATNVGGGWCTIVGNAPLVAGVVGTWTVCINRTFFYGDGVYVGVAPIDIDQNAGQDNFKFCGWYYECYYSRLHSGPPHKCSGKEYGPRTKNGNYVRTGDNIDVILDLKAAPTTLAFRVAGKDLGTAFEEIPLDRPLVPAVILGKEKDSVIIENTSTKY